MSNDLSLKDQLAAIDLNAKEIWGELSDKQKKSIVFFTLNRYISSVQGSADRQAHAVIVGNERFNKNLFVIMSKHPKLTWQTACSCSYEDKSIGFHPWIGLKREKDKKLDLLCQLFPDKKIQDLETLNAITDKADIKRYLEASGWDNKRIKEAGV
jgi:hypothetical protein